MEYMRLYSRPGTRNKTQDVENRGVAMLSRIFAAALLALLTIRF
jgi:hypothetical protein